MLIQKLTRALALAGAVLLPMAVASPAAAEYPDHTIRIIVPFAAGGPTDTIARLVAGPLGEELGQAIVVENRPGAGSNLGTGEVAHADPDGYTLLITSSAFMVNPSLYPNIPYNPVKDFAPIMTIASSPNMLVANPATGIKTVADLIAKAKAAPGTLNYASPGAGTTGHLAGELFKIMTGTDMLHVPFGGAGPAIQAILAGTTDIAFTALPPTLPHVRKGTLVALGVTSAQPWPEMPDVPTVQSQGLDGYVFDNVQAFLAPAGTPQADIDLIVTKTNEILKRDDVVQKIKAAGFQVVNSNPKAMAEQIAHEVKVYGDLITSAGIKLK